MPKIMFNGVEYAGSGGGGGGSTWTTDIPEMHRNIFRGQSLGSSVTSDQLAAIEDGSFDDIYVGDYWTIPVTVSGTPTDIVWRIVDIDYYLNRGAMATTTDHHLVIMPDTSLYSAAMGSTNYYGVRSTVLAEAKTTVNDAFPNMVIPYSEFFGYSNGNLLYDNSAVEVPDVLSLTGNMLMRKDGTIGDTHTISFLQFALFRLAPKFIPSDVIYWTRDINNINNSDYIVIDTSGRPGLHPYNTSTGVRPYFLIGVQNE